jgi:prolyl-tRNA editing enzyme YbaK/EbsC (Cys-tRNA(Pro) deacylase)
MNDRQMPGAVVAGSAGADSVAGEAAATERSEAVRRVEAALRDAAHPHPPQWLEASARTAREAADALGVDVGQIAKSVVFRRLSDDRAVLVITSGDRRVDEAKLAARIGALGRADAEFVKRHTGFSIGGVSPVGHVGSPLTLIDCELFRFSEIWAAAGHPNAVFRLSPAQLRRLVLAAVVADVTPGERSTELRAELTP